MNKTEKLFEKGINHFNKSEYELAKNNFLTVLKIDQNNLKANHALGVCYGAIKDHDNAKKYFEIVLKINKNFTPSLFNLAVSNYELGNYETSSALYQELLKKDPKNYLIYLNLGNCYFKLSEFETATSNFIESINLNKNQIDSYLNIAIIKKIEKNFDEALKWLFNADLLNKNHESILYHLADTYYKKNDFQESIVYLKRIQDLYPKNTDSLLKLALAHFEIDERDSGNDIITNLISDTDDEEKKIHYLQKASAVIIKVNSNDTDKDYSIVLKYSNLVLDRDPNNVISLSDRAIAKYFMGDVPGSILDSEKALELKPNAFSTLSNVATLYRHIGKYAEAELLINKFDQKFIENNSLNFLHATVCLAQNKFKLGWKYYESRWYKDHGAPREKPKPQFIKPEWVPDLGYDSILVWAEQGLGDQILHGTMLNDFSQKFKKTYLAIDPRLLEVFKVSFPEIEVFSLFDEINQDFFDYQIPLTSIGQYCRKSVEDFNYQKNLPYKNLFKDRKKYQGSGQRLKCALSWSSSLGMHSRLKTIPLLSLLKVLQIEEIDFYNIQYTDHKNEINDLEKKYNLKLHNPPNLDVKNDIEGVMNFIHECDFVISCSNTNVHLAGAVGQKTYVLAPIHAGRFWYWNNNHEGKNLWYPSIKIIEQKEKYSWDEPISELIQMIKTDFKL